MMIGINYLTMKEVAERLKYKSVDAAARWCLDNNVAIIFLGNKRVVIEYELNLALDKLVIDLLMQRYGNKWKEYYDAYKTDDITKLMKLEKNDGAMAHKPIGFNTDEFFKNIGYDGKS